MRAASGEKGLRSLQPKAVLGQHSLEARRQETPLAAGGKTGWSRLVPNGESEGIPQHPPPHCYCKEFNELFSKTVLLMILLIFTDFIVFHLLVHTDLSILFTKRYSAGFL